MHVNHDHTEFTPTGGGGVAVDPEAAPVDPIAHARVLLANHEQQRREACAAEIDEVLARHGFYLRVTPAQVLLSPIGS